MKQKKGIRLIALLTAGMLLMNGCGSGGTDNRAADMEENAAVTNESSAAQISKSGGAEMGKETSYSGNGKVMSMTKRQPMNIPIMDFCSFGMYNDFSLN